MKNIWKISKTVEPLSGVLELEDDLKALRRKTHQTIRKVTIDIEDRFHFNTAISAVMELVNAVYQIKRPGSDDKIALATVREALESGCYFACPDCAAHYGRTLAVARP